MNLRILLPAIACVLSVSCRENRRPGNSETGSGNPEPSIGYTFTSLHFEEADFTTWVSRAELQVLQQGLPDHQYFARVEGRDHLGRSEYRAAIRAFPGENFEQWAVFWGINDEKLFHLELQLIENGFIRNEMQSFKDASGEILNQIVWLRPIGGRQDSKQEPPSTNRRDATAGALAQQDPEPSPPMPQPPPAQEAGGPPPLLPGDTGNTARLQPELLPDQVSRLEPAADEPVIADPLNLPDPAPVPLPAAGKTYLIRSGDTLGRIARKHGVSVANLKEANQLKSDFVKVGQKLIIPVSVTPAD